MPLRRRGVLMAAHKAGEPGCCCGPPCHLCVAPTNPCGPIVGATVTVYGNQSGPDNNGADIVPSNNDTTYGSGTTDSTGSFCLTTTPGVFMVETSATGYETDRRLTYGCLLCGELSPKFSLGNTVNLNTDSLDTTLTAVSTVVDLLGRSDVPKSTGSNTFPIASVQVTTTGYGGFTCDPYFGLPIWFYAGCGPSGMVEAHYEFPVWECSFDAFGSHYEFRGNTTGTGALVRGVAPRDRDCDVRPDFPLADHRDVAGRLFLVQVRQFRG
jgi:hypothetical protein